MAPRQRAEQQTGLCLTQQVWQLSLDRFPGGNGANCIPRGPVTAVTSIDYADVFGDAAILDATLYETALGTSARSAPAFGNRWPATRPGIAKVTITFTVGYDAPSLSLTIKQAMLMMVSSWFDQRSDTVIDRGNVQPIPRGADFLLNMHKLTQVGFEVA